MSETGSVSELLKRIPKNDQEAYARLWERYFQKLVEFARRRLRSGPRSVRDEEDIALSAFDNFYENAKKGRFPSLSDRQDLWQILVTLTKRKLYDHLEFQSAQRRDWHRTKHGISTPAGDDVDGRFVLELISKDPSPEFAAEIADNFRRLFGLLGEDKYRKVALLKFEGYSNAEIAKSINRVERTVTHRLTTIRKLWEQELAKPAK